jgi:D-aspartate ligase
MGEFRIPAIVLGGGAITGLGAIRSLGRTGVTVYYMDEKKSEAIHSKYCKKYFIFPEIGHNEDKLKSVLLKLEDTIGDAVLFPASDSYAIRLPSLIDELNSYYLPAPEREVIEILINKRRFYESLMEKKIPHPTTYFPENLEAVKKISTDISYPIFIKPYFSQPFSERFHKKGFVANSERDLLGYFTLMNRLKVDVMIQEIILGPPTDHIFLDGYADRNSNPKAFFARRRLRMWPLAFGNSSLCVSIPTSEVNFLKKMLFSYLKSISYSGIFSAELKKDDRDGGFKLLEINSRTSAWFNTLSAKCGINIMLIAYLDAIGRDIKYSEDYEAGIKWVFLRDDLRSAVRMVLNGDLSTREWISSLFGKKDYVLYAKDDLRPLVMNIKYALHEMV